MNIYELEKLATLAPHESHIKHHYEKGHPVTMCEDCFRRAQLLDAQERLQRHKTDNFMRLLAQHKKLIQRALQAYPLTSGLNREARECYDTVTELEEVK